MATITTSDLDGIQKAIKRRKDSIKERQSTIIKEPESIEESKAKPKSTKKAYPVTLRVAAIIGIIFTFGILYSYISVPSLYDAVMAIFRDIWPSFDAGAGMEWYVD